MSLKTLIILSVIGLCTTQNRKRYDNYSLYKIYPQNEAHKQLLQEIYANDRRFNFWNGPVMRHTQYASVLSSPNDKEWLESVLNKNGVEFEITLPNIQKNIDNESTSTQNRLSTRNMRWDVYYTLDAINAWIDELATSYPNVVSIIIGGSTFEGREIRGLKISHGPNKRIIFLEGGMHANEWISPAVVNFVTNELLTSEDEEIKAIAREFDWYILPVLNPDGYIYAHEVDRMWRKNRRPITGTEHYGVDLNRNWNNNWAVVGAGTDPQTNNFAGPGPFSETETRTFSEFLTNIGDRIDLYLSFHSFGQMLLLPFGNTTEPLANYHESVNIGRRAMGALAVRHGTMMVTGNIAETIYLASGGSIDWIKEDLNVPIVYAYELRDQGEYGMLLPPDQILPNSEEVMDSILDMIYQAKRFGIMNSGSRDSLRVSMLVISFVCLIKYFL